MKENRMKNALESIARRAVSEDIDLMPSIAARLERKSALQIVRARPTLVMLIVVLALVLLSGVAYAVGKVTGYIPGIGIVDQGATLRVLAEPVSITREGITLTIEQVLLSADKSVVVYKVEGIPPDAYVSEVEELKEGTEVSSYSSSITVPLDGTPESSSIRVYDDGTCISDEYLRLSDGSSLPLQTGEGSGWSSGFENRHVFGPVPLEMNEATFILSCIPQVAAGKLPENWEVTLQFIRASPDIHVLPVIDLPGQAANESQNPLTLEQVIETDDGYILIGKFRSIGLPEHAVASGERKFLKIIDANGNLVNATHANGMGAEGKFGEFGLAYEINGKSHVWPLTLVLDEVSVLFYQQSTEFAFDTGPNPKPGQKWIIDPDVQLMGYDIHEVLIERTGQGYAFTIKSDPDVEMVVPEIKGFPASTAGGGSDGFGKGETYYQIDYKDDPPFGKLTIQLGWLQAVIRGPWYVQWQPKTNSTTP